MKRSLLSLSLIVALLSTILLIPISASAQHNANVKGHNGHYNTYTSSGKTYYHRNGDPHIYYYQNGKRVIYQPTPNTYFYSNGRWYYFSNGEMVYAPNYRGALRYRYYRHRHQHHTQ